MNDVNKNVDIAINIIGGDPKVLKGILTSFESVATAVKDVNSVVDSFKTNLESIKEPKFLVKFATSLKTLSKVTPPKLNAFALDMKILSEITPLSLIKFTNQYIKLSDVKKPNLNNFTENMLKLSSVGSLPDLSPFAASLSVLSKTTISANLTEIMQALTKFKGITLPNLENIAVGFEKLAAIKTPHNLTEFETELRKFDGIKLGNLNNIALGFAKLEQLEAPIQVAAFVTQLKKFEDIKLPNFSNIASGFEKFNKIRTEDGVKSLETFSTEVKRFQDIKLPNFSNIAMGFEKFKTLSINSEFIVRLKMFSILIKQFADIKLPNFSNIAMGFEKFADMKKPVSLADFVKELEAFKTIKLPNLKNIAEGFKLLDDKTLDVLKVGARLRVLKRNLTGFTEIKVPNFNALVNGLKKLTKLDMDEVAASIKRLNTAIKTLSQQGGIDAFKQFANDVSTLKTAFDSAAKSMTKIKKVLVETGNATKTATGIFGSFIDKLKTVAQFRGISDVLMLMKQGLREGALAILEYDQALKDLQAITGATSVEIEAMGSVILKIASTTKFSASEVAAGMRTIGQAGFSAAEAIQTMQAVSNLATGTLSDMSSTVDLVTTAMRVYRLNASESALVSDVFANAVNKSKLTIDKLRTALNYVGPVARDAGIGFQELTAAMSVLANSGLRPSTIGTGLRQTIAALIDPSEKLIKAADAVGVSLSDLDPRSSSLSSVMSNLNLVISDSSVAFDIFGKRGASAALALASSESGFETMLATIGKQGTAAAQAAIQMEGLGVSFKNLQDKLKNLAITLGDGGIATAFRVLIDLARLLVDIFTTIADSTVGSFLIGLGVIFAGVAAIGGIATVAMITLNKVLGLLIVQTTAAAASTSALGVAITYVSGTLTMLIQFLSKLNPYIIAVTLLGAAFITLHSALGETAAELEEAAAAFQNLSEKFDNYLKNTSSMEEGSNKLIEANKNLRAELFAVAGEYGALTSVALTAALSINAITGEVTDGGTALTAYSDALDALRLDKLLKSGAMAVEELNNQNGFLKITISGIVDDFNNLKSAITGSFTKEMAKGQIEAAKFAKAIADGAVSVQEMSEYIANLNMSNLSVQQKDIIKNYMSLSEQASKALLYLQDTGQISMQSSIDEIKAMAENAGFTGLQLEAMLFQIKEMQEAGSKNFGSIIEKWEFDGTDEIVNAIQGYKDLGGAITEAEEAQIRKNATDKQGFIDELTNLQSARDAQLEAGADYETVWRTYHENRIDLEKRANTTAIELNKNRAAENIKLIQKEKVALEKELSEIEAKYIGSSVIIKEARIREQTEAIAAYKEKEAELLLGILADQKVIAAEYKSHLQEMKTEHSKYVDDLAIQESKGEITSEQFNEKKLQSQIDLHAKLLAEAEKYLAETPEGDTKEYEKRHAAALKAEQAFYKAKLTLTIFENKAITKAAKDAQKELLDSQASAYKDHLQELRNENAAHNNELALQESEGKISAAEFDDQKLASAVDMYAKMLDEAIKYQNQVSAIDDPEEYKKRRLLTLKVEQDFLNAKLKVTIDHNKDIAKAEEEARKQTLVNQKAAYNGYQEELKTQHSKYLDDIAIQESKGLVTNEEFNQKKLDSAVQLYAQLLQEANDYLAETPEGDTEEYDKRYAERLKAEQAFYKAKLDLIIAANKAAAKAEADAQKQLLSDQASAYKSHLQELKTANSKYIDDLAIQESKGALSAEEFDDQKLASAVDMYAKMLDEAIEYQNQVSIVDNPEEYESRRLLTLKTEQDFYDAKLKLTIDHNKDAAKAEVDAQKQLLNDQKSSYTLHLEELKTAHSKYIEFLAIQESKGLITNEEFNAKKLGAAVQLYDSMLDAARKYLDETPEGDTEEYDKRRAELLQAEQDYHDAKLDLIIASNKAIAQAEKEAQAQLITNQETDYKKHLQEMDNAHADYINKLAIDESKGAITNAQFNKAKLDASITLYKLQLEEAESYRDEISEIENPEEYEKRAVVVLKIEENLLKSKLKKNVAYNKQLRKDSEQAKEEIYTELKAAYDTYLASLKSAHSNHNGALAILEAQGKITTDEYNSEKLKSTIVMYAEMLVAAKKYQEEVAKEQGTDAYLKAQKATAAAETALKKAQQAATLLDIKIKNKAEEESYKETLTSQEKIYEKYADTLIRNAEAYQNKKRVLESKGLISTEKMNELILASNVKLQEKLLTNAEYYRHQSLFFDDVDEYEKRNALVIKAKDDLEKVKLGLEISTNKALVEAEKSALKEKDTVQKQALKDQLIAYKTNVAQLKAAHAAFSEEQAAKEKLTKEVILNLDVQLKTDLLKLAIKHKAQVDKLRNATASAKTNAIILEAERDLSNAEIRLAKNTLKEKNQVAEDAQTQADNDRKEAVIASGNDFKLGLESMKTEHSKYIDELARQESSGVITHEEYTTKKLTATIEFYARQLEAAKNYQATLDKELDTDAYAAGLIKIEKLTQSHYNAKLAYDLNYNKSVTTAKKALEKLDTSYASKKLKIAQSLASKLKSIDQEIADNKKAWNAEIASDEMAITDKIYEQWKKSNDIASGGYQDKIEAYAKLKQADQLLNEAVTSGDEEKLKNALKLISASENLANGLDDEHQSAQALNAVLKATSKARDTQYEINELELIKKKNEEIAEASAKVEDEKKLYTAKVKAATEAFDIITKFEAERHAQEMANIKTANDLRIRNAQLRSEYEALGENFYLTEKEYITARGAELASQGNAQTERNSAQIEVENEIAKIKKQAADYQASGGVLNDDQSKYIEDSIKALKEKSSALAEVEDGYEATNKKTKESIGYVVEYKDGYYQVEERIKSTGEELIKFNQNTEESLTKVSEGVKNVVSEFTRLDNVLKSPEETLANFKKTFPSILGIDAEVIVDDSEVQTTKEIIAEWKEIDAKIKLEEPIISSSFQELLNYTKQPLKYIVEMGTDAIDIAANKLNKLKDIVIDIIVKLKASASPVGTVDEVVARVKKKMESISGDIPVEIKINADETKTAFEDMIASLNASNSLSVNNFEVEDSGLKSTVELLEQFRDKVAEPVKSTMLSTLRSQLSGVDDMFVTIKDGMLSITDSPTRTIFDNEEAEETLTLYEKLKAAGKDIPVNMKTDNTVLDKLFTDVNDLVDVATTEITPKIDPSEILSIEEQVEGLRTGLKKHIEGTLDVNTTVLDTALGTSEKLHNELVNSFGQSYQLDVLANTIEIDDAKSTVDQLTSIKSHIISIMGEISGQAEIDALLKSMADVKIEAEKVSPEIDVKTDDSEVDETSDKIESMKDRIIRVSGEVIGQSYISKLQDSIDNLKDKTITITTKYKSIGDSVSGYAQGGRLPGFGGGDKIPLLGEAGEWIINKFAVQKYGNSFLSGLNSMSLPKFQNGGAVSSSSTVSNISNVVNKTKSDAFSTINDFGKIVIDTGKIKIPVIAHKSVVSELTSYMKKTSLMGVN